MSARTDAGGAGGEREGGGQRSHHATRAITSAAWLRGTGVPLKGWPGVFVADEEKAKRIREKAPMPI